MAVTVCTVVEIASYARCTDDLSQFPFDIKSIVGKFCNSLVVPVPLFTPHLLVILQKGTDMSCLRCISSYHPLNFSDGFINTVQITPHFPKSGQMLSRTLVFLPLPLINTQIYIENLNILLETQEISNKTTQLQILSDWLPSKIVF